MLTTKKVYWNGVLHELYWFLSGQSNINIWSTTKCTFGDDYPYKIYREKAERGEETDLTKERVYRTN